jgi:hypothetical protein
MCVIERAIMTEPITFLPAHVHLLVIGLSVVAQEFV